MKEWLTIGYMFLAATWPRIFLWPIFFLAFYGVPLLALIMGLTGCSNLHLPDVDPEIEQMKHPTTRINFPPGPPPDKK